MLSTHPAFVYHTHTHTPTNHATYYPAKRKYVTSDKDLRERECIHDSTSYYCSSLLPLSTCVTYIFMYSLAYNALEEHFPSAMLLLLLPHCIRLHPCLCHVFNKSLLKERVWDGTIHFINNNIILVCILLAFESGCSLIYTRDVRG